MIRYRSDKIEFEHVFEHLWSVTSPTPIRDVVTTSSYGRGAEGAQLLGEIRRLVPRRRLQQLEVASPKTKT